MTRLAPRPERPRGALFRLCSALLGAAGLFVPRWRRAEWRREWEAELWHRWMWLTKHRQHDIGPSQARLSEDPAVGNSAPGASGFELVRRTLGAVRHALWLRGRDWRFDVLMQDLRYAVRTLSQAPGFTVVAILTLGIGIAANTTVFSFVNAILLRPYPYSEPERIVRVFSTDGQGSRFHLSYPDILDHRDRSDALEAIAAVDREPYNLSGGDETVYVQGAQVSASLFAVLGVEPIAGRTFRPEEDLPGADNVVVLSESLWRNTFAADPTIVGKSVTIDAEPYTVIGVVPRGAAYPDEAWMWVTLRLDPAAQGRASHWVNTVARLKPGVSIEQAQAEMSVIAQQLEEEYPDTNEDIGVGIASLRDVRAGDVQVLSLVLLGAVGFVLLIACANVANLLLAKSAAREREIAIRAALGAGRTRILRQLVTESALLALAGSLLGLLLGLWAIGALETLIPIAVPDWVVFDLDLRILSFTATISVLATLFFGLVPAIQVSKPDLNESLKEAASERSGGSRRQRARSLLVIAEVALSIVLLVGAGLMIKSFLQLSRIEPGFESRNAFMMTTAFARVKYPEGEQRIAFYESVKQNLEALPGVVAVGGITQPPLRGGWSINPYTIEGQSAEEQEANPSTITHTVTADYLEAAGIPLLRGRDFTAADLSGPEVALINEELARHHWPDEDPIGKRFKFGAPGNEFPWMEIVGVVGNVKHIEMTDEPAHEVYYPYQRFASFYGRITWVVRTDGDPRRLIQAAQAEIRALDPDQAVYDVMTMQGAVDESLWAARFMATLLWVFGGVALGLAAIGIYGLISFTVARRTREIGVRMAIGAHTGEVLRMVLRQGMTLVLIGAAIGLAGSLALTRLMQSLLFEVSASDPAVFAGVALLLAAVALIATLIPARRATRIDPIIALRNE